MNVTLNFHPDIIEKFQLYSRHTNEKHKIINEFVTILKSLCDLEQFYSRNLEKLAESTSKLIVGKDTLKQVFIIFERILATKSEQAKKLAEDVKHDMMPFVKSIAHQDHFSFKKLEKRARDVKLDMERKHRVLQHHKNVYTKAYKQLNKNYSLSPPQQKEEMKANYKNRQNELVQNIGHYNNTVESYLLTLSEVTNKFSEAEGERKRKVKDSINKFIIYQISCIKNIEYNINSYCKSLEVMEDKLVITQKFQDSHDKIPIAKVSPQNFIEYMKSDIVETEKLNNNKHELKLNQLKQKYPGEVDQNKYKALLKKIYSLLDYANQTKDIETLKKLVQYGNQAYKILPEFQQNENKIYLIQGMFCHDIFREKEFWNFYLNKVLNMLEKQTGSMASFDNNARETIEEEFRFVRSLKLDDDIFKEFFIKVEEQMRKLNVKQDYKPEIAVSHKHQPQVAKEAVLVEENTTAQMYSMEEYDAFS